jgi:hypothetical protein
MNLGLLASAMALMLLGIVLDKDLLMLIGTIWLAAGWIVWVLQPKGKDK